MEKENKKTTSVICAIVKDEQRFIREWAEYYLNIGFDKLYVYEDFGSRTHKNEISDYIEQHKVELISLDDANIINKSIRGTRVQSTLYSLFLSWCRKGDIKADWIGFFDVDEFLVFDEGYDLNKLEEDFSNYGGVLLAWKIYGANGHISRPSGGVVESYTKAMPLNSRIDSASEWNVKSLVNVSKCDGKKHIHVFNGCVRTDYTKAEGSTPLLFEKAWLNHYFTKSWEDYLDRIFARGNMQNNFRCLDKFFKCNPDLLPKKYEMVMAQRYRHAASTMWISRDMKIISGGNERKLKQLRDTYK